MSKKQRTWIISDTHFGNKNILKYAARPFSTVEEMDEEMIRRWNDVVHKDDIVWHLGDFSLKSNQEYIRSITSKLRGRKRIILGNHDNSTGKFQERWHKLGFEFVSKYPIIYKDYFILSHAPIFLCSDGRHQGNINGNGLEKSPLMHCANFHGHLHGLEYNDKRYINVSVECVDYTPMDLDLKIQELLNKHNEE